MKFLDVPQSGSIAGTTHSHNRAGQYTRNRRSPVQPVGTGRRAFIRGAFGAASSAWSALTAATQASWITFANSHPYVDRLGQAIKLTGHQMFVALQTQWQNILQSGVVTVPAATNTVAPVVTVFTAVSTTGVVTLTLDGSGPSTDWILVAFARPQSPGRTFVNAWWQADVLAGDSVGNATEGAKIVAEFGTLIAGFKLFYKLTPVNQYGFTGVPVSGFAVIS